MLLVKVLCFFFFLVMAGEPLLVTTEDCHGFHCVLRDAEEDEDSTSQGATVLNYFSKF